MEQENKYYTPDISELHVGYCNYQVCYKKDMWTDALPIADGVQIDNVIDLLAGRVGFNAEPHVRTKYLDKSDIESCGWTCQEYTQNGYNQSYTKNVDSESGYDLIYCEAWDKKWQIDYCGEGIYWGEIKSINELKKIMKYLKIK